MLPAPVLFAGSTAGSLARARGICSFSTVTFLQAPAAAGRAVCNGRQALPCHASNVASPALAIRAAGIPALSITRGFAAEAATPQRKPASPSTASSEPEVDATSRQLGASNEAKTYGEGFVAAHPSMSGVPHSAEVGEEGETFYRKAYDMKYLESITPTHQPPVTLADKVALNVVRLMRRTFDMATGYGENMNEAQWLRRCIFLETVAGVPGMVAGMLRHLHSLRLMRRDKGWIFTLLEEAENERMHLVTFLELRRPGPLFRAAVLLAQGVFFNAYFLTYLVWPKVCHSFVGYLEEEAVRTYTHALADIDAGKLWPNKPAPPLAIQYWGLRPDATMRDMILAVRADEACHSHVNHTLKSLPGDAPNPFAQGKSQLP